MLVQSLDAVESILVSFNAVELVPASYCEHIIGESRVWAVTVSPELASRLLEVNTRNRKLMKTHAASLAKAVGEGMWWVNGKTICFARNGDKVCLTDGQHRLKASVESGESFATLVVTGLDPNCFVSVDTLSRSRLTSQVFEMNGEKYTTTLASAVRHLHMFCKTGGSMDGHGGSTENACAERHIEILDKNPGLRESTAKMMSVQLYRTGISAALHYLFSVSDAELAEEFFQVMKNGDSDRGRPFNVFRESFIRYRGAVNPCPRSQAARAIKAFNAEKSRSQIKALHYRSDEAFPKILGIDYSRLHEII